MRKFWANGHLYETKVAKFDENHIFGRENVVLKPFVCFFPADFLVIV